MAEPALDVNNLTPTNEGGGLNIEQGANLLAGVLNSEQQSETEVETDLGTEEELDNPNDQQLETEDDYETDESEEEESDDEELEDESDDESGEEEGFEIDGEFYTSEQLLEWKDSGLRQDQFTKLTQEVAEVKQEAAQVLEQTQEVYQQQLQSLQNYALLVQSTVELDGLSNDNLQRIKEEQGFEAYAEAKDTLEARQKHFQEVLQVGQQIQEQMQADQEKLIEERFNEAQKVIADKVEGYLDEEQGPEIRKGVKEMLVQQYDIPEDVLDRIDIPGLFIAAYDLMNLKQSSPTETQKTVAKKKASRKVSPVNKGKTPTSSRQRVQTAKRKLVDNAIADGSVQAGAAALAELMKGS